MREYTYTKVTTVEKVDDRINDCVRNRKPLTHQSDEYKPVKGMGKDALTWSAHPHDHVVHLYGQPTYRESDHQQDQHSIQL